MANNSFLQSAREVCTHVFVRYGSGADYLRPITKTKWWNTACWVMIVLGTVGWVVFLFWPE